MSVHMILLSQLSQYSGCWWPCAHLAPEYLQSQCWCRPVGARVPQCNDSYRSRRPLQMVISITAHYIFNFTSRNHHLKTNPLNFSIHSVSLHYHKIERSYSRFTSHLLHVCMLGNPVCHLFPGSRCLSLFILGPLPSTDDTLDNAPYRAAITTAN